MAKRPKLSETVAGPRIPISRNPSAPDVDGAIGLPPVDNAMNKVDRPNGEARDVGSDENAVVNRAVKRFKRASEIENDNRIAALEDLKFYAGQQWPADVETQRRNDKRPCLTINVMPTFVKQVTNDLRQNRPAINVIPVGEGADKDVAQMHRGMIRGIERDSNADVAYDTGVESAARMGWGYWRVLTEYESPDSFHQVLRIGLIRNAFTVYLDPQHQEPDGSDAKWGFVTEMIARDDYDEEYPDADPCAWSETGVGENLDTWITKDAIRVAEYFETKHVARVLIELSNGHVGWEDELDDLVKERLKQGATATNPLFVERKERRLVPSIRWFKLNAKEILEERDWPGSYLPIVKVTGDWVDIEGRVYLNGIVRNAKDAQRMINFWETSYTEMVALAPKAPFVGAAGQFEGYENQWKQANTKNYAYLQYNPTDINGTPVPPPQRQEFAGVPQAVQQGAMNAQQHMMSTTGISLSRFDAREGLQMHDDSGKAMQELRRTTDIGAFHYADNFARSLRRTAQILIDLIPKIYDAKRIATIIREDDGEEQVMVDPDAPMAYQELRPEPTKREPNPKIMKIFNPNYGRYGVTATIGPSYATKRQEAAQSMMAFAKALPNTAQLIADLIAESMDWPGAEKIAARFAKTLPPQLLTPEQKDVPPQIQAMIEAMDQQMKAMAAERQQLLQALSDTTADRAIRVDEINKAFEAKTMAVQEKFAEALLKVDASSAVTVAKQDGEFLKMFISQINTAADQMQKNGAAVEQLATIQADVKELLDGVVDRFAKAVDGISEKQEKLATAHVEMADKHKAEIEEIRTAVKRPKKVKAVRDPKSDRILEMVVE